jgi:hypothetical protein
MKRIFLGKNFITVLETGTIVMQYNLIFRNMRIRIIKSPYPRNKLFLNRVFLILNTAEVALSRYDEK